MSENKTLTEHLIVALRAHERAKSESRPEDNPFAAIGLDDMTNAGLLKSADRVPARNMAATGDLGFAMEAARFEAQKADKRRLATQRKARERAKAARRHSMNEVADSDVRPSSVRLEQAWAVVVPLMPIIAEVVSGKARWASRYLGSVGDDAPSIVMEKIVLLIAKSEQDLDVLRVAAHELGQVLRETRRLPQDQSLSDHERAERKSVRKARKWLMGVVNNRVMQALRDLYAAQKARDKGVAIEDLDLHTWDLITTTINTINAPGEDPIAARFKADRAPAFLGTRFQAPGRIDPALMAAAINAAISERGLDPMVEFLLDERHRRDDGAIAWTKHAEDIFRLTPGGDGDWMWQTVIAATTERKRDGSTWEIDRAAKARGDAARAHVRVLFEFLPHVVTSLADSFDPHPIGYAARCGGGRKILASDFELFYAPPEPEVRQVLVPALRYSSAEEAAHVLVRELSLLVSGQDLVASLVSA